MRILIVTPWKNAWIPLYTKAFEERGHQVAVDKDAERWSRADVYLHMWAGMSLPRTGAVNLMFMRRFEFFDFDWRGYDWSRVDRLIFCNSFFKSQVDAFFATSQGCKTELVYNAVDTDKWTFKERGPGKKIGMACHVHWKKNLPLAAQILMALGDDYELHIAGEIQDPCTALYLQSLGLKITFYGHVKDMNAWWEDKNYCLSTSLSEGNPNNVLEAMARGIRPVVHGWPGAADQFPWQWRFNAIEEAVSQIKTLPYRSEMYLNHVEKFHGLENFRRVVDMAEEIHQQKKEK